MGWRTPVLVVCPINPFEWPVKASVAKYAVRSLTGAYKDSHYRTVYFHNSGPAAEQAYHKYWNAIANAVDAFRKKKNVFVIIAATEAVGRASGESDCGETGRSAGAHFGRVQHV